MNVCMESEKKCSNKLRTSPLYFWSKKKLVVVLFSDSLRKMCAHFTVAWYLFCVAEA